jgi:hypothetical protein
LALKINFDGKFVLLPKNLLASADVIHDVKPIEVYKRIK